MTHNFYNPFQPSDLVVVLTFSCGWLAGRLSNRSVEWRRRINLWVTILNLFRVVHSLLTDRN